MSFAQAAVQFSREYEIITEGERSQTWTDGREIRLRVHLLPSFGELDVLKVTPGSDVPKGTTSFWRKTSGLWRDTVKDSSPAWVVRDRNYISARWPGDVHTFVSRFSEMLGEPDMRYCR